MLSGRELDATVDEAMGFSIDRSTSEPRRVLGGGLSMSVPFYSCSLDEVRSAVDMVVATRGKDVYYNALRDSVMPHLADHESVIMGMILATPEDHCRAILLTEERKG